MFIVLESILLVLRKFYCDALIAAIRTLTVNRWIEQGFLAWSGSGPQATSCTRMIPDDLCSLLTSNTLNVLAHIRGYFFMLRNQHTLAGLRRFVQMCSRIGTGVIDELDGA